MRVKLHTVLTVGLFGGMVTCAAGDKALLTAFTPEDPGEWRFTAVSSDTSCPPDSESAEQLRLQWLQEDVIANQACPPNGVYKVDRRTVVHIATSYIGVRTYDIIYDVAYET